MNLTGLACPDWCDSAASPGHWTGRADCIEAIHTRRFGPVTVNLYVEAYRDGTTSTGPTDVVIHHAGHTQQIDGETVLTSSETACLASHLTDAARFARALDQGATR